jgi:hypothetical protein
LTEESNFVKDDGTLALNNLVNIVKRSTGKINIQLKGKTALALKFEKNKLSLDIIEPTIFGRTEQDNNDLGLFEKIKAAKKVGRILNNNGLSVTILRKGKRAVSIGREATPTISSLLTGSDDIQIDSIKQVTKLGRDIKKANHNKDDA